MFEKVLGKEKTTKRKKFGEIISHWVGIKSLLMCFGVIAYGPNTQNAQKSWDTLGLGAVEGHPSVLKHYGAKPAANPETPRKHSQSNF